MSVDRRLLRFEQARLAGQVCGVGAAILLTVILFGWINTLTADWSWPPNLLPLLMTILVILAVTFVVVEVANRALEAQCARQEEVMLSVGISVASLRRLRREAAEAEAGGRLPAKANGDERERLSDEALRGYFLGLADRETPGGGEAVA